VVLDELTKCSIFFNLNQVNAALTKSVMEKLNKINQPQFGTVSSSKSKSGSASKSSSAENSNDREAHDEAVASMVEEMRKILVYPF